MGKCACMLLLALAAAAAQELPPIVFVSRAHLPSLNDVDIGPPVDIAGRELTPGGTLNLLRPNGEVVTLAGLQNAIFDVQRPMPSFDGSRVVFSGVRDRGGMWRIFEIGLDGRNLRQLTPRDCEGDGVFARCGDFSPAYLPDGRIVFSSTRYPTLSESTGERGLALYIVNGDGSGLRRIVSARSAALAPSVMADGRILFAMWADNMNIPSLFGPGLQPLEPDTNFSTSWFEPWAVNPDGSGAARIGFLGGSMTHGTGGGIHYREAMNGEILYTRRTAANMMGSTLASAIAKFRPGAGDGNTATGLGDPLVLEAAHALAPEPLPDGRIVFSYAPRATVTLDDRHRNTADFDFGLYLCDGDFKNLRLLYDRPGTDELDAAAVYPRRAQILPDLVDETADSVAVLESRSLYADLDRRATSAVSPLTGSVTAVDVYDDSFDSAAPMPRLYRSFPVNDDGSFHAELPADRPVFLALRGPAGAGVRYPDGLGAMRTAITAHFALRPGEQRQCAGCHRGHMIRPDWTERAAINLGRLAYAAGSSTKDATWMGSARAIDGSMGLDNGRYQWVPSASDLSPWLLLTWEQPVTPREIVVYPRPRAEPALSGLEIFLSDGPRIVAAAASQFPDEPIALALDPPRPITWMHVMLSGPAAGIAEIAVNGDAVRPEAPGAPLPPRAPALNASTLRLSWLRSPSHSAVGYKILAGTDPDNPDIVWDVGNAAFYQPERLTPGVNYCFRVRAYDAVRESAPSDRVCATLVAPRVDRISPASGPVWGGIDVTIEGAGFASGAVAKIGGVFLRNVRVLAPDTLLGTTDRCAPGQFDVLVRNPSKNEAALPQAFRCQ